jgi:aryl-alcohol dehydrogenase-like predicted oxidoreductase
MQYRTLGRTNIKASAIAFGGIMVNGMAEQEAANLVSMAFDRGVNYFDVAPSYGNAQYVLGPALSPYRNRVSLACKSGEKTAEGVTREIEESLRALKTDHFDVYQLHCCDDALDTVLGPGGALEAIVKARQAGKVRFIGFSSHRERSALYLMSQFDFDTIMQPVNWANNILTGKSDFALALARQKGMGLIAIKALALRALADGEPKRFPNCWYMPITDDEQFAQLALKFTLSRAQVAVSPGEAKMLELMLNLIEKPGTLDAPNDEELSFLKAEAEKAGAIFKD